MMSTKKLIGPFTQIVTMRRLPLKGPLSDAQLEIIPDAGIVVEDEKIVQFGDFNRLFKHYKYDEKTIEEIKDPQVLFPGFVDPHTHICWAGSRVNDFALRLEGKSYTEIAKQGGGIWSTVLNTRQASSDKLYRNTRSRANALLATGTTTIEVKSGYGLTTESEIKILEAIYQANKNVAPDLVATCLAAHMLPADFKGTASEYLKEIVRDLLPVVMKNKLSHRVDIYVDEGAFSSSEAEKYLNQAKKLGFDLVVHADQFTSGGSKIAIVAGALSADHLEASGEFEIEQLIKSKTIPVALPGASLGLGVPFAPARKLLNAGTSLAMGSDWNPGTAPMGDLLVQASILGVYEKLSIAEILAAITFRSSAALNLNDRGILDTGNLADFSAFPVQDYREIIYNQGKIKPVKVWKKGKLVYNS